MAVSRKTCCKQYVRQKKTFDKNTTSNPSVPLAMIFFFCVCVWLQLILQSKGFYMNVRHSLYSWWPAHATPQAFGHPGTYRLTSAWHLRPVEPVRRDAGPSYTKRKVWESDLPYLLAAVEEASSRGKEGNSSAEFGNFREKTLPGATPIFNSVPQQEGTRAEAHRWLRSQTRRPCASRNFAPRRLCLAPWARGGVGGEIDFPALVPGSRWGTRGRDDSAARASFRMTGPGQASLSWPPSTAGRPRAKAKAGGAGGGRREAWGAAVPCRAVPVRSQYLPAALPAGRLGWPGGEPRSVFLSEFLSPFPAL